MINFIINYWWQLTVILLAAIPSVILFTIKSRITHWFSKDLETHRSELERKSKQIQLSFDTQLETLRIQFGVLHSERLQILKEACTRITELLNMINAISSFYNYDCKENVDYESKCVSEGTKCDESCILNYWQKIVSLDKYTRQTHDFFLNNQMFFPLEVVCKHYEIITLVYLLRKDAYEINLNLESTHKEKALKSFELFHNFDESEINSLQRDLTNEYRVFIGVSPLRDISVDEFKLYQIQKDKLESAKNN